MKLYHGSEFIIEKPDINLGKENNDYGRGFYCTTEKKMAGEWACKRNKEGYINVYELDDSDLKILDLLDGNYSILNWIALLLKHRTFGLDTVLSQNARNYIIENYSIDISEHDVVIGYRADDSYFQYAEAFVKNALPLSGLNRALKLGKLGEQVVLVSEKAFANLGFVEVQEANKQFYYPKFIKRDIGARKEYKNDIKENINYLNDIFVMDILREEMTNDDSRIQRILRD